MVAHMRLPCPTPAGARPPAAAAHPIGYDARMGDDTGHIPADRLAEFEAAARRPLAQRWRYAFIRTHKPVMDDARFRAFDTMADYRRWCEANLPRFLGYHRV
jgi:hypothetical protein